jgi:catechol 2,3-dioxygenase-like lactoylglutathione lyase family enzyme
VLETCFQHLANTTSMIDHLDHLVLTTRHEAACVRFYVQVLDLCLIASLPLEQVQAHLAQHGVEIECGPVLRTGAQGAIRSVYVRDPDLNLIEISEYLPQA